MFNPVVREACVQTELLQSPAILVVDDEPVINLLITRYFTHLGYQVLAAASGEEALEIVRRRRPPIDLVLSDVIMPGMDGRELAGHILAEIPGPAVLLMTGQLPDEIDGVIVQGHSVRVVHKPLHLDRLAELLTRLLPPLPPADDSEPPLLTG
jgi:two-component system cell cycle sensor histidine kinase/response regulator CckA